MKIFFGICVLAVVLIGWSCEQPRIFVSEGSLTFSEDTVKFDSIFVNVQTPSERLIVSNRTDKNINISRIWLTGGNVSEFSLIVDGQQLNDVSNIELAQEDSLRIFISLTSELRDDFAEDLLNFQIGEEVQTVVIRAFVVDAYLLRARIVADTLQGFAFTQDTVLTPDKPIMVDGPIFIPEGVTVTIDPGTQLYFSPYRFKVNQLETTLDTFTFFSQFFVLGTLKAEGTADEPIGFQSNRFNPDFEEKPAQWRGIIFHKFSRDNVLRHVLIKNAQFGVLVDSAALNENPKLLIQNSEIRNMSAFGLYTLGLYQDMSGPPAVVMENSVINTCREQTLFVVGGGKLRFYNCTFANFNLRNFSRRSPQVLLADNILLRDGSVAPYPGDIEMVNCAIWGSEDSEIALGLTEVFPFNLKFDHCLVRYTREDEEQPDLTPFLENSMVNSDPLFNDPQLRDYRPQESSPLIDAGRDLSARYLVDFRDRADSLRTLPFDIGAYEFFPIEE